MFAMVKMLLFSMLLQAEDNNVQTFQYDDTTAPRSEVGEVSFCDSCFRNSITHSVKVATTNGCAYTCGFYANVSAHESLYGSKASSSPEDPGMFFNLEVASDLDQCLKCSGYLEESQYPTFRDLYPQWNREMVADHWLLPLVVPPQVLVHSDAKEFPAKSGEPTDASLVSTSHANCTADSAKSVQQWVANTAKTVQQIRALGQFVLASVRFAGMMTELGSMVTYVIVLTLLTKYTWIAILWIIYMLELCGVKYWGARGIIASTRESGYMKYRVPEYPLVKPRLGFVLGSVACLGHVSQPCNDLVEAKPNDAPLILVFADAYLFPAIWYLTHARALIQWKFAQLHECWLDYGCTFRIVIKFTNTKTIVRAYDGSKHIPSDVVLRSLGHDGYFISNGRIVSDLWHGDELHLKLRMRGGSKAPVPPASKAKAKGGPKKPAKKTVTFENAPDPTGTAGDATAGKATFEDDGTAKLAADAAAKLAADTAAKLAADAAAKPAADAAGTPAADAAGSKQPDVDLSGSKTSVVPTPGSGTTVEFSKAESTKLDILNIQFEILAENDDISANSISTFASKLAQELNADISEHLHAEIYALLLRTKLIKSVTKSKSVQGNCPKSTVRMTSHAFKTFREELCLWWHVNAHLGSDILAINILGALDVDTKRHLQSVMTNEFAGSVPLLLDKLLATLDCHFSRSEQIERQSIIAEFRNFKQSSNLYSSLQDFRLLLTKIRQIAHVPDNDFVRITLPNLFNSVPQVDRGKFLRNVDFSENIFAQIDAYLAQCDDLATSLELARAAKNAVSDFGFGNGRPPKNAAIAAAAADEQGGKPGNPGAGSKRRNQKFPKATKRAQVQAKENDTDDNTTPHDATDVPHWWCSYCQAYNYTFFRNSSEPRLNCWTCKKPKIPLSSEHTTSEPTSVAYTEEEHPFNDDTEIDDDDRDDDNDRQAAILENIEKLLISQQQQQQEQQQRQQSQPRLETEEAEK